MLNNFSIAFSIVGKVATIVSANFAYSFILPRINLFFSDIKSITFPLAKGPEDVANAISAAITTINKAGTKISCIISNIFLILGIILSLIFFNFLSKF